MFNVLSTISIIVIMIPLIYWVGIEVRACICKNTSTLTVDMDVSNEDAVRKVYLL